MQQGTRSIKESPLLALLLAVLAVMQGSGLYLDYKPPNESSASERVLEKLDGLQTQVSQLSESFLVSTARHELRLEGLESADDLHRRSPHPDNTTRALENSRAIVDHERRINSLEFHHQNE